MGHCLGLFHTHSGRGCGDTENCAENINGSNCTTCGDLVCDTPADPCLSGNVDAGCNYIGNPSFNPATRNIMSYSPPNCLTEFTFDQMNRIHAIIDLHPLFDNISYQPVINGTTIICNSEVFEINNLLNGAFVTWSIPTSAGTVLQLSQNTPSMNQLTITNQKWYSIMTTLTAEINDGIGDAYSITKTIINDNNTTSVQHGSWSQPGCWVNNHYFQPQSGSLGSTPAFLNQRCLATVNLSNMVGRTVSYSGSTQPHYWSYSKNPLPDQGGTLLVELPLGSSGAPFSFTISGDGACTARSLLFFSVAPQSFYSFFLSPNPTNDFLTLTVNFEVHNFTEMEIRKFNTELEYSYGIYSVATGKLHLKEENVQGKAKHEIDISRLKSGYYTFQIELKGRTETINFIKK